LPTSPLALNFTFAYVFEINKQTITFVDSDWNFFELPVRYAEQNTLTVEQFAMQVYEELKVA